jgi:hypothetical protein
MIYAEVAKVLWYYGKWSDEVLVNLSYPRGEDGVWIFVHLDMIIQNP